jgi:hypothetical protein
VLTSHSFAGIGGLGRDAYFGFELGKQSIYYTKKKNLSNNIFEINPLKKP